jgi:predicted transcriptional regulator of viral defense system
MEVIYMNILTENKKFITIIELRNMGYSYYKINKLEENGWLRRVNRSTYENLSYKGDENDFFSAEAFVPNGVICLMSAARYYELTNFLPDAVDVAIERKKKVSTLPEWPQLRVFYFDSVRMDIGVNEVQENGNSFHIFDIEKTVVDIIYYRNKIGIEETSEVLRNYLNRKDRQIDRLYAYAKRLRCEKVVRTYLEVLI